MASATPTHDTGRIRDVEPATYTAGQVSVITGLATPTIYEIAREDPARLGAVRFGRAVRFRRAVIDRLVHGDDESRPSA